MVHVRFRLRTLLALPVLTAVSLSLWMAFTPGVPIDGDREIPLEIVVRDARSGRPIGDALVRVADPYSRRNPSEAITQTDGHAKLTHAFEVEGERRAYRTEGVVHYGDRWLEVSATGYVRSIESLAQRTGESGDIHHLAPPPLRVGLLPGKSPAEDEELRAIAARYGRSAGMGGTTLTITADGRFAWTASGCIYHAEEFGYARMVMGELQLTPIKRSQGGTHPNMLVSFYPIRWGNRLFLVDSGDAITFCNRVNQGYEIGDTPRSTLYLRQGDWEREVWGIPVLPPQWRDYLLKEPVTGTIGEVLKDGTARVNRGTRSGVKPKMEFQASGSNGRQPCWMIVLSVEVDSCVVARLLENRPLAVGESVTTRFKD